MILNASLFYWLWLNRFNFGFAISIYQFICALFILFVVTFFVHSLLRSLVVSLYRFSSELHRKKENFLCVLSQRGEMNNNKDSVKQLIFIVSVASLYWYVLGCCCNFFFMLVLFFFLLNKSHRRKTFTHLWALFALMVYWANHKCNCGFAKVTNARWNVLNDCVAAWVSRNKLANDKRQMQYEHRQTHTKNQAHGNQ